MRQALKEIIERKQAIALYYDGDQAPEVTASGIGPVAQEILDLAKEHNIPIYENPELVDALCKLEVGEHIPEDLYQVIAEIIAFVFYLQGMTPEDVQERKRQTQTRNQYK